MYDEMKSKLNDFETMMQDLVEFLEDLPVTSPYRWPVVGAMTRRIPDATAAERTGMNINTIHTAKQRVIKEQSRSARVATPRWLRQAVET